MNMNRRRFIQLTGAAAAAAMFAPETLIAQRSSALDLVILHTNDVHSHLEPLKTGPFKGFGGAAIRHAMIEEIRARNKHVLLLDSGDMFQGTAWFNIYQGEAEIKAMSAQGYTAAAIGNHDFDAGIERLAEVTKAHAKFPLLCTNLDFTNTAMEGLSREYIVQDIEGLRVGILGTSILLDGLVSKRLYGETKYSDPAAAAARVARVLRHDEKCDFIICISHSSLTGQRNSAGSAEPGDRAISQGAPEIDIVLGGHNHILMDEPELVDRGSDPVGFIQQTGWAGSHIGAMNFRIHGRGQREVGIAAPLSVHQLGGLGSAPSGSRFGMSG